MTSAELLMHPVRLRVVEAFPGDRKLTTADLRAELPDVPPASLYRHLAWLIDAGVLDVVAERKVRGTVERTYVKHDRYLERDEAELRRGGATFRVAAIWLTDDELSELAAEFGRLLRPYLGRPASPGRTRRVLRTIVLPGTGSDDQKGT